MKNKDKYRIKDRVDDGSDQHAYHGVFRTSVSTSQIAHAVGDDKKGHAESYDSRISFRIGHDIRCGAESGQQRLHENLNEQRIDNTEYYHHADSVPYNPLCDILFTCSQMKRKSRGASDPDQERDGKADCCKRISYICSGVSEIADALTDENLVYDII